MIKLLDFKLKTIRDFQEKYPTSHVGGSFGLFLLGYDLQRDLSYSDLDLICPAFEKAQYLIDKNDTLEETSNSNDFDFKYRRWFGNIYIKHDICIDSEQEFQIIERNGEKYNVSLFENIMKFKREYAEKGIFKHEADIITIETGKRPTEERKTQNTMINTTDFLNALRSFEYIAKQDFPKDLKVKAREEVIFQLGLLKDDICDIDLGDEMEVIEGTNDALKNL